jgi:hypothetical protein
MRGQIHEAQGDASGAIADFRKATELPPKGFFDLMAQADAKKRVDRLGRNIPCGTSGRAGDRDTCL